jgi:hypothetical protein
LSSGLDLGMHFLTHFHKFFSFDTDRYLFYGAAELSPPPEPYDPEVDPSLKGALDVIRIANDAIDEAVDRLLNEATDKVLRED